MTYSINNNIQLLPHQEEAISFSCTRPASLLSLRTGSGKSLIVIGASINLLNSNSCSKFIIFCTKSSLLEVHDEYLNKSNVTPTVIHCEDELTDFYTSKDFKVGLIQYETLAKLDLAKLFRYALKVSTGVALDESQKVKNPKALLTKSMVALRRAFKYLIFLTATPISSKLEDLFCQIHILDKTIFKNRGLFLNNFVEVKMIKNWKTGRQYPEIVSYRNLDVLRQTIAPVCYQFYPVQDTNYITHSIKIKNVGDYITASEGLFNKKDDVKIHATRLIDLQHVVDKDDNKVKLYLTAIKPYIKDGLITYCHFMEGMNHLASILDRIGIDYRIINGQVSIKERREIKSWFNSDPSKKILLISSAGSTSLNLNSVNNLFFYNTPYGVGAFTQCRGRIERMFGKFNKFFIHFILTDIEIDGKIVGTVDRYKYELISAYGEITEKVFNSKEVPKGDLDSFNSKMIKMFREQMLWVFKKK